MDRFRELTVTACGARALPLLRRRVRLFTIGSARHQRSLLTRYTTNQMRIVERFNRANVATEYGGQFLKECKPKPGATKLALLMPTAPRPP